MKKLFLALCIVSSTAFSAEILPEKLLFTSLGIDPAESRMSAMYGFYDMYHEGGLAFGTIGNLSIGGHMPIVQWGTEETGAWQFGLDAASKMQFMLDQPSLVMAQADESFGIDFSWKKKEWSSRIRAYHVSSHLGDEYMEATGYTRFQYNTEGFDILLAYEPIEGLRVFGGGDYYFNTDPLDIGSNMIHFGGEYIHPTPLFENTYFIVMGDFKLFERNDYSPNSTGAIGFEFKRSDGQRHMRILLEGYTGSSPHTQFYYTHTNYYGVTLQFGF
ncbi:MAG: DUF1207 domain-containing protein [Alphaproteobacteria bacterium]|nr:DUF1207 domain-containing protein [Alphaproteobacteria bacterium]